MYSYEYFQGFWLLNTVQNGMEIVVYYRLQPSCRKSRFSMKDTTRSTRMQLEQKVDGNVGIRIAIAIQATDSLLFKDYDS